MSDDTIEQPSEELNDTSVVEEASSQEAPSEAESIEASQEQPQEKPAPFHEHPRFKELIEQNREARSESERAKQELARLQYELQSMKQQLAPKKEEPVDPFLRDLEKVNPEYAKSFKVLQEQAAKAAVLEQQWQQYQAQQYAEKAYSHLDGLLKTNKVEDPMDQDLYRSAIEAEVFKREHRGEKLTLNDLDKIFSSFHTRYMKYNEDRERAITSRYTSSKRSDQTPAPTTGGAATTSSMKKFSSIDSPEAIKWFAEQLRSSKQQ